MCVHPMPRASICLLRSCMHTRISWSDMRAIGTTDGELEGGLNVRLIGTTDGERETGDVDLNGLGLADRRPPAPALGHPLLIFRNKTIPEFGNPILYRFFSTKDGSCLVLYARGACSHQ
jgi:hypothetical protein